MASKVFLTALVIMVFSFLLGVGSTFIEDKEEGKKKKDLFVMVCTLSFFAAFGSLIWVIWE